LAALVVTVTAELWIARRESGEAPSQMAAYVARLYGPVMVLMLATYWMEAYSWERVWRLAGIALVSSAIVWRNAPMLASLRPARQAV
jgi:hypothetical protein